jgi:hypothetical protein
MFVPFFSVKSRVGVVSRSRATPEVTDAESTRSTDNVFRPVNASG